MTIVEAEAEGVVDWLMSGDPAISWQTLRDLRGASQTVWGLERAKVGREGWGRKLLDARETQAEFLTIFDRMGTEIRAAGASVEGLRA